MIRCAAAQHSYLSGHGVSAISPLRRANRAAQIRKSDLREKNMTHVLSTLRTTLAKRAAYHRTVDELRNLPIDVALDLDIYPGDAERIAYETVYGR